ncbi:GSCFA domain-containing protein [uncultured Tateyamaria sp.]|uniref:GSCFA domain-containing protein n=1 Tax=Tateyamaria sp. 1078 TaxID=3417464 RepID=UPI0026359554|nr:GSCFA domain-containing protein [uncultured Tateyamaria sp.]
MTHPYEELGPEAFWKTAVAEPGPFGLSGLWSPKFPIRPRQKIVTAGSCFAQHIGRALADRGYGWIDCEPAPPFMQTEHARSHGYGVFSFRTGNIYTPAMLLQWLELAYEQRADSGEIWVKDDRFYDPLRPAIEPGGFETEAELWDARHETYAALRRAVETSDVFVFTLGLTERWRNSKTEVEYALCPGTVAGTFDPAQHVFVNSNTRQTQAALTDVIRLLRAKRPKLRILLTVSPVPLTATASGKHVLTATHYSKSVLRAVAGMTADRYPFVDYFPSYEIITHPVFRGMFFAPNMRSVVPEGVATVMKHFFADQIAAFPDLRELRVIPDKAQTTPVAEEDLRCEEVLLDAFAR